MATRSQVDRFSNLLMIASEGGIVRLGELGSFVGEENNPAGWHKDLCDVEFVVAETVARLGVQISGMFLLLKNLPMRLPRLILSLWRACR